MTETTKNVALLAPVPENLLIDGEQVCVAQGEVAFGSRAYQVFRDLDAERCGEPVDVYIYASHADGKRAAVATWTARYVRSVEATPSGRHPEGLGMRPRVGADAPGENRGHWAVYWHLANLRRMARPLQIKDLQGLNASKCYRANFVPERPLRIEHPS